MEGQLSQEAADAARAALGTPDWDETPPDRAKALDKLCWEMGADCKPVDYPEFVRIWNRVIARVHGRVFDPSRDREQGPTPSG